MRKFVLTAGLTCLLAAGSSMARADGVVLKMTPAEAANFWAGKAAERAAARAADTGPREWHNIKLNWLKPGTMAWFLDPANQPEPAEFVAAHQLRGLPTSKPISQPEQTAAPEKQSAVSDLPPGVDEIKTDEEHRGLVVLASEKGFENLQKIVNAFDKPIRTGGFAADVIETDEESIKQMGLDFSYPDGPFRLAAEGEVPIPRVGMAYARNKFQAERDRLLADGSVRIVANYMFSAKNNLPAFDTAVLTEAGEAGRDLRLKLIITPTVNNDDTVTVVLNVSEETQDAQATPPTRAVEVNSVFNVRNGDSVVLSGIDRKPWGARQAVSPANPAPIPVKHLYLVVKTIILEGKRAQ